MAIEANLGVVTALARIIIDLILDDFSKKHPQNRKLIRTLEIRCMHKVCIYILMK